MIVFVRLNILKASDMWIQTVTGTVQSIQCKETCMPFATGQYLFVQIWMSACNINVWIYLYIVNTMNHVLYIGPSTPTFVQGIVVLLLHFNSWVFPKQNTSFELSNCWQKLALMFILKLHVEDLSVWVSQRLVRSWGCWHSMPVI